jgi:hypothetical protein
MPRTQRDQSLGFNGLALDKTQPVGLGGGGGNQHSFGHCQSRVDAHTRTGAERQVGKTRPAQTALFRKPCGIEALGFSQRVGLRCSAQGTTKGALTGCSVDVVRALAADWLYEGLPPRQDSAARGRGGALADARFSVYRCHDCRQGDDVTRSAKRLKSPLPRAETVKKQ